MCFEEKYLHPGRARGALGRGMVTYRAGQRAGLCCRRGHILADHPGTAGKDTHTHTVNTDHESESCYKSLVIVTGTIFDSCCLQTPLHPNINTSTHTQ